MGLDPLRDLIRGGYERGRNTYGELRLSEDAFAHAVLARVDARMRARGQEKETTGRAWAAAVQGTELADVYLAVACEAQGETAWRVLAERFRRPLGEVAKRNGVRAENAASWVRDLLAELAVPSAPGSGASRFSAYDGTSSLEAWLTFVALRRARAMVLDGDDALADPRVVAWAEGRLDAAGAAEVAAGVGASGEARLFVDDLRRELRHGIEPTADPKAQDPAPKQGRPLLRRAIVAVGLLGVGAAAFVILHGSVPPPRDTASSEGALVEAAERLVAEHPDRFKGFHPVTSAERALGAAAPEVTANAFVVRRPRGVSLDGRPTAAWIAVPGARQYTVRLLDTAGATIWHRTTVATELVYPAEAAALVAGAAGATVVCEVAADTPTGRPTAKVSFTVASPAERAIAVSLLAEAGRYGVLETSLLLRAHVALRHGWWDEAERLTRVAATTRPGDAAVQETLAYLRFEPAAGR